jgi:hypothetical protein
MKTLLLAALAAAGLILPDLVAGSPGSGGMAAEIGADGTIKSNTQGTKAAGSKKVKNKKQAASGAGIDIPGLQGKVQQTLQQTPILPANTIFQLPLAVDPRSMNLGGHRRQILIADGKLHNKVDVPWWKFWESEVDPFPYGYLLKPNGELFRKLLFKGRTLQPYGIAESPEDGRVAVTFYQGPQTEVWESDLSMAWSYNEQAIHPTIPFFMPTPVTSSLGYPAGSLAVPFDTMDVLNDKDNGTVGLWVYSKDAGKRVELFRRRQFQGLNLPHSISVTQLAKGLSLPGASDENGKPTNVMFAVGLQEWIWEEGRGRGMWLVKPKWKEEKSPVRLNLYQLIGDKNAPEIVDETGERWRQDNGFNSKQPRAGTREIEPYVPKQGMRKIASYRFSGICKWPLLALVTGQENIKNEETNTTTTVPVQYAVTACYDADWIEVLRLTDKEGGFIGKPQQFKEAADKASAAVSSAEKGKDKKKKADTDPVYVPMDEPITVSYIRRPFGITQIGSVVADPSTNGQTIAILDRNRKRIYSAPFPFPAGKHDTEEQLPPMTTAAQAAKEKPEDDKLAEIAKKSTARARHPILRNGEGLPVTSAVIPLP